MPQLMMMRFVPDESSKARQPACASWLTFGAGEAPVSTMTAVDAASIR
jgi:hypothetical protein